MAESAVPSPFPPGTTEAVIWVDANGRQVSGPDRAERGEVTVTFPDGRVERTYLTRPASAA